MADDLRFMETPVMEDTIAAEEKAEQEKARKMSKKRKLLLYGVAGLIAKVALGFGVHYALVDSHYVSTDNAYVDASTAQINAQVSGQVLQVMVSDTQSVRAGEVLAVIDPADAQR